MYKINAHIIGKGPTRLTNWNSLNKIKRGENKSNVKVYGLNQKTIIVSAKGCGSSRAIMTLYLNGKKGSRALCDYNQMKAAKVCCSLLILNENCL